MADVLYRLSSFLAVTSIQILVLGVLVLIAIRVFRLRGSAACRALSLVILLPFLTPLARLLPEQARLAVPSPAAILPGEIIRPDPPKIITAAAPAPVATTPPPAADLLVRGTREVRHDSIGSSIVVPWGLVLTLVWVLLAGLLTIQTIVAIARLRGTLHRARVVRDRRAGRLLQECVAESGIRWPPRLLESGETTVPFLAGVLRPSVVLPEHLLRSGDEQALRFALLHELSHQKHRHSLWIAPEVVLRTVYFFHPIVRYVLRRFREEREYVCDQAAARISGRPAGYAEFLLAEATGADARQADRLVLALRHGTSALSNRIRRLASEGNQTMNAWNHLALLLLAGCALLVLVAMPATVVIAQEEPAAAAPAAKIDNINATVTKEEGVYHVMPVFFRIETIYAFKRGGPYGVEHRRVFAEGTDYTLDKQTGRLVIKPAVDDEKEMISVRGERVMPWEWQAAEPFTEGSVRILLGERAGVEGVDFEVDEAKGFIRFLKLELCDTKKSYYITYGYPSDPATPTTGRSGSIGNHRDREAVRRFLGLAPRKATPAGSGGSGASFTGGAIGTNASPTDNPRVWTLTSPLKSEGLKVGILPKGQPGNITWLTRGEDYSYDETIGKVVFLKDIAIDREKHLLYLNGVPADRSTFIFHGGVEAGSVKVILGDKRLVEGTGFTVNTETGVVKILDPAIREKGAKYFIQAGNRSVGNRGDMEVVRKLLAD